MTGQGTAARVRAAGDTRRQDLVLAAFTLIAERGFEGLRTRDVADRAGVNVATLHYYFPTKESLIRGVLEHAMGRFQSTLVPSGSPSDQLRNHLRAVRRLMVEEPELAIVMAELGLRSAHDRTIAAILSPMYDTWHAALRAMLRKAAREGRLKPDLDLDGVAALIVATLTAITLPPLASPVRKDRAVRQLERWLGLPVPPRSGGTTGRRTAPGSRASDE